MTTAEARRNIHRALYNTVDANDLVAMAKFEGRSPAELQYRVEQVAVALLEALEALESRLRQLQKTSEKPSN